MRKIKLIVAATSFVAIISLCSCGNKDMWDTSYTFNKAMCYGDFDGDGAPEWEILDVDKWTDYEDGDSIQIETTDSDVYLFHASNCTLIHKE